MIDLDYDVSGFDDASRASETNGTVASITSNEDSAQNTRSVDAPPGPFDVLSGRGRPFIDHPGNDRMRTIVEAYKAKYKAAEKQEKTQITKEVVEIIKNGGEEKGRFLKQQSNGKDAPWFEVSTKEAHKKVGHRLRDDKTKSVIQLVIAKRRQVVQQEMITEPSVPLDEQPGWSIFASSIASPLGHYEELESQDTEQRSLLPLSVFASSIASSLGHNEELESRDTEQPFLLPLSVNFPRYQSGTGDRDEEEIETEMGENLDGDKQEGEKAELEDPLDLSLADSNELSNEQARYLLDRLEHHLEIEDRLVPIVTAQVLESSAGDDRNFHIINQSIPAQSLEGQHFISCVAETIDSKLPDDFHSLLDYEVDSYLYSVEPKI